MLDTRLKTLRKERNIKQRELAQAIELSTSTIAMYETGNRDPDTSTLQKLADFFDVSVDYLLGRSEEKAMYVVESTEGIFNEDSVEYNIIHRDDVNRKKVSVLNEVLRGMIKEGIIKADFELNDETQPLVFKRFEKLVKVYGVLWDEEE